MSNLRESKKVATRRALATAAATIMFEQGEQALTVAAVAEAAGVSTRTFHNYFASREEALSEFVVQSIDEVQRSMEQLPPDTDIVTAFEKIVHGVISEDSDLLRTISMIASIGQQLDQVCALPPHNEVRQLHCRFEEFWQHRFPTTDPDLVRLTLQNTVHTAGMCLSRYFEPDSSYSTAELHAFADKAFALLRQGTTTTWQQQG
ncbi:transcriptional regulator BetI [Corynebacterium kalinowskii]|uniref:Transcriptional regulator BetI n=1 Tax=Corynebacterium kalinowskii TaxID=2675216 RepID=A0A6B8W550_9CORY|nr:TetR family transcriptional regulator [Corynebacterium kalinowskii]QGU02498.1 transcriptional regulator BetI [Corynebacterium kalinowskii]